MMLAENCMRSSLISFQMVDDNKTVELTAKREIVEKVLWRNYREQKFARKSNAHNKDKVSLRFRRS